MKAIIVIFISLFCLQNISSQRADSENDNYLGYTVEGESFKIKNNIAIDITVLLNSPSIIYNVSSQEKNKLIQFEWEKMDQNNDVGTFSILNGNFTDAEKEITNKEITGKVIIKKADYKSPTERIITLEGLYEINISMPDRTNRTINGNFYYEGEYTISL